jgi:CheY-like chemotaxis protein
VATGSDCLAYLRREGQYANAARPELIVLDNQMPGMTGTQVLQELGRDSELRQIPVLHWSSAAHGDIGSALRSRGCARKPWDFEEYRSALKAVCDLIPVLRETSVCAA